MAGWQMIGREEGLLDGTMSSVHNMYGIGVPGKFLRYTVSKSTDTESQTLSL